MYLIGISSNCYGAGKTTLAQGLAGIINNIPGLEGSAAIVSFATPIKEGATAMIEKVAGKGPFDKTQVILGDRVTYRDVLLGIGQLARSWDPDFWLKTALYEMRKMENSKNGPEIFIIDDMRFPNEFKYINEFPRALPNGSCTIYLNYEGYRGEAQNAAEGLLDSKSFDINVVRSEQSTDKIDSLANAYIAFEKIRDDLMKIRECRITANREYGSGVFAGNCFESELS